MHRDECLWYELTNTAFLETRMVLILRSMWFFHLGISKWMNWLKSPSALYFATWRSKRGTIKPVVKQKPLKLNEKDPALSCFKECRLTTFVMISLSMKHIGPISNSLHKLLFLLLQLKLHIIFVISSKWVAVNHEVYIFYTGYRHLACFHFRNSRNGLRALCLDIYPFITRTLRVSWPSGMTYVRRTGCQIANLCLNCSTSMSKHSAEIFHIINGNISH